MNQECAPLGDVLYTNGTFDGVQSYTNSVFYTVQDQSFDTVFDDTMINVYIRTPLQISQFN